MHAFLAKALDRWIIRRARRCEGTPSPTAQPPIALTELANLDPILSEASRPPQGWSWGANGSFRFTSPLATAAHVNNTAFGRFYPAAEKWAKHPTAILLHGWNAEVCYRQLFPRLAARFKRAGLNTAMLELPYHMQRRPPAGPVRDFISSNLAGMIEATRQAIADTRALCRWLESEGSPALGVWGFSLGAWLAGLMARAEPGLRFVVLATPIARLDRAIDLLPFCQPIRESLRDRPIDLSPLNLSFRKPASGRKSVLLIESRHDLFAPVETVEELWQAWERPEIWRLAHGHISVLLSMPVADRTVHWIAERAVSTAAHGW